MKRGWLFMSQCPQYNRGSLQFSRSILRIFSIHNMYTLVRRKLICLLYWAFLDTIVRLEKVIVGIKISNVSPWKTFLCWMWTIYRIEWNKLMSLGRASRSIPFGSVFSFFPRPCILGSLRGRVQPFVELLDSLGVSPSRMDDHGVLTPRPYLCSGLTWYPSPRENLDGNNSTWVIGF